MYFMQQEGLNKSQSAKYLNVGIDTFNRLINQYKINRDMINGKFIYYYHDLDKIKNELEERKKISSIPSHQPMKNYEWHPGSEHVSLVDIAKYYNCSKQNICRLININGFKFQKFFTKEKNLYYLKSEIFQYFVYKGRKYETG